jgi:hypothetical protein
MIHRLKHIFFFLILNFVFTTQNSYAQTYPVQITTLLNPPFSGYLPDYGSLGNQNLKLLVQFNDFTKPSYNIKLKFKLTGQNITLQSKSYYFEGPFTLIPGVPLEISGSDLAGLLSSNNLDFSNLSKNEYETGKVLPEGLYTLCFTAYDYNNPTNIQVSNQSCYSAWMLLNDPPYLNMPLCGNPVTVSNPQNLTFLWTSMNLTSPNSAANTSYEFSLYQIQPNGASPNNIIQTLPPIYQTTTALTTLNYGLTDPVLNLGREYVWRVKAIDNSGRDVFKNQGYSQLCTFTYGSMAQFLDSSAIALTLQGTPLSYRQAKCFWDTLNVYKSYTLYYKATNGANWVYNDNVTKNYSIVDKLEPSRSYYAYLRGVLLDDTEGPASNTVTINTPPKIEYQCGQSPNFTPTNTKPLKLAAPGQLWEVGQFDVQITNISSNPINQMGQYSGFGKVAVPFLGNANFNVKFTNITVNEQYQVIAGKIDVITEGINSWVKNHNLPAGWNQADTVKINGQINSVSVNTSGQILVNGSPVASSGSNVVISGSNGQTTYVSPNGSITTEAGPLSSAVSPTLTALKDSIQMLQFSAHPQGLYNFDSKQNSAQTAGKNYESLQQGTSPYYVAEKLLITGTQDKLIATLSPSTAASKGINLQSLYFKRSNGKIIPHTSTGNNTWELSELNGRLHLFKDALWAFAKKANSTDTNSYPIGKINLSSVDKLIKKVKLIPVNTIGASTDATALQTQLNALYKKAGLEWQVSKEANLSVSNYNVDSLLTVSRSALNTSYGADLKQIINAYKAINTSIDSEQGYLFLCNKAKNNELGYMALNKTYGFIFLNNNNQLPLTIAHELGHGKLVLEHTFAGSANSGSSQNLMDYNGGNLFNHLQLQNIHDPKTLDNFLATLVQDSESGALFETNLEQFIKDKFGVTCYNTYKNYDGVIPQCFWNNSACPLTIDDCYSTALMAGLFDGLFVVIKDLYSLLELLDCWNGVSPYYNSQSCNIKREKTINTVRTVIQICKNPNGASLVYNQLKKSVGEWGSSTFCADKTCAYNQGRLLFDILSLVYGGGEIKAVFQGGITATKLVQYLTTVDRTFLKIVRGFKKGGHQITKVGVTYYLKAKKASNALFTIGTIDALKKAIRFSVPLSKSSTGIKIADKLENLTYVVVENGQDVIKHGDVELFEESGVVKVVVKGTGNSLFSKNVIATINGFADNIASLASQQGISLNDFKLLQQKRYEINIMTPIEKAHIDAIRDAIPIPNGNTILQKVFPKADIQKYLTGPNPYNQIGGFVSTAQDSKHLNTFDDIYHGMRLDYTTNNGIQPFKLSDGSCGVIRYKTANPNLTVPKLPTETGALPYTGNGFTGGNNGRLGVPEWKSPYNTPNDGAELWEVFSNGDEVLKAKFSTTLNKFILVQ